MLFYVALNIAAKLPSEAQSPLIIDSYDEIPLTPRCLGVTFQLTASGASTDPGARVLSLATAEPRPGSELFCGVRKLEGSRVLDHPESPDLATYSPASSKCYHEDLFFLPIKVQLAITGSNAAT